MLPLQRIGCHISLRHGAALATAWLIVLAPAPAAAWHQAPGAGATRLARLGGFGSGSAATGRALIDAAERAHKRGNDTAAIAQATRAIETGSLTATDLTRILRFRARVYRETGAGDRAIADYTALIDLDPQDAVAFVDRGWAFYQQALPDRAIADYTTALRLRPEYALAYNNRCVAYLDKQLYDRAIDDCSRSIALNLEPNLQWAYRNRALAHGNSGDHDRAIEDFTAAIRIDPQYADAYVGRGWSYSRQGLYERALQDYTTALGIKPRHALAYNNRCLVHRRIGQVERAIADCSRAIELDLGAEQHWAYANRAWAYLDKRGYDLAIADYDRAIALKPDYARAFYGRGRAFQAKGDRRRAARDYRRAAELEPANPLYSAASLRDNALAAMITAITGLIGAYTFGATARRRGWRKVQLSLAVLAGFLVGACAGLLSATASLFV